MIIWKGLGILVPFIAILGAVLGAAVGSVAGFPDAGPGLGVGLAAAGNWWLWRTITAKRSRVVVNPTTGQQVLIQPKNTLFFIPAGVWTWPMALLGVVLMVAGAGSSERQAAEEATPGFKEFQTAYQSITTGSDGKAHGNTPAATAAAESFAAQMKSLTAMAFTGGSKKNLMTGGEFLTYCHEGKDTVVILCHVPSLRSYKSEETKTALAEIAWAAGRTAASEGFAQGGRTLIVGLRGITGFGSIQKGLMDDGVSPESLDTSDRSVFYAAFAPEVPVP